ncbi:MAG: hypothetical protein DMD63_09405 [Gemmatimonadetes bacterium]|nr:MAG: hypothetical protein DMD63_09405 [Gemmatimonadota bacterium]
MSTQVIFLFGRPGVGKLTVGEHLTAELGYRLLHNHEALWHTSIEAALRAKVSGVIMTFAPEATVTDHFIPSLQKRVLAGMGTLHFIELQCTDKELEKRISSEPRERFGKLRDVYKYRKLDEAGSFDRPAMPKPELVIDTTNLSPLDSARAIAKHLRQVSTRPV